MHSSCKNEQKKPQTQQNNNKQTDNDRQDASPKAKAGLEAKQQCRSQD